VPHLSVKNRPGGGASGKRLGSHLSVGSDGADCPSVLSGLTASVESGIGGFFGGGTNSVDSGIGGLLGGSTMVCRCSLRAVSFDCGCRLLGSFGVFSDATTGVFSGKTTGVASGNSPAETGRPLGSFWESTHRMKVSFSSSIAAHPEKIKLADTAIEASATRAQARIETLVIWHHP
jgi:hypothetical protein